MGCRRCGRGPKPQAIRVQSDNADQPSGQRMPAFLANVLQTLRGRRIASASYEASTGLRVVLSGGIVLSVPVVDDDGMSDPITNVQLCEVRTPNVEEAEPFFDFGVLEDDEQNELTVGELQAVVRVTSSRR